MESPITNREIIPDGEGYPKRVKRPGESGSFRITPPEAVRVAVSLQAEEPWAWFYDSRAHQFYVRRVDAALDDVPDHFEPVGVVLARDNGRYLDFAIPHVGSDRAGIEKGQTWTWYVNDHDTLQLVKE